MPQDNTVLMEGAKIIFRNFEGPDLRPVRGQALCEICA
jgi:hypothetical protein